MQIIWDNTLEEKKVDHDLIPQTCDWYSVFSFVVSLESQCCCKLFLIENHYFKLQL